MGESLFYNRDVNISGVTSPSELAGLSLTPSYGSSVSFPLIQILMLLIIFISIQFLCH